MKCAFTSLVEINDDLLVSFRFVVIQAAGAVHRLVYQKSCKYRVVEYYQIITSRALDFNLLFLANDFYHILLVFIVTI